MCTDVCVCVCVCVRVSISKERPKYLSPCLSLSLSLSFSFSPSYTLSSKGSILSLIFEYVHGCLCVHMCTVVCAAGRVCLYTCAHEKLIMSVTQKFVAP